GTAYRLAFLTSGANGLAAALDLARALELEGRAPARRQVVQLAAGVFDASPQLAELKALLGAQ
ncbi:MAG: hypothetical protein K1X89_31635, partial [Myxococcaceae bacterium]|nr:hypothetical protein [Myxococcaceae bacterium]